MGYRVSRLLVAVCLSLAVVLAGVALPAAAAPFSDVPASDPAYTAITELAARGIIKGCDQAAGRFCPNEPTLRAQMAALIARAMQWDGEDHGTQFADRCDPAQGCIDNDLWRNVGTLQFYGVAKGFDATSYGPHVNVAQQQVILFISRAMVKQGSWQRQPDNAGVYPNLPRGSAAERLDAQDVVTYVHYVGAAPDTQSSTAWGSYAQASTRAWFARALWQVLARFPVGPAPSTPPGNAPALSISPASGPAGTRFVVTGVGAPAGAAIGWVFSYGGVGANSGSFVLDPGMTAFTFTVASDSDPAGAWALCRPRWSLLAVAQRSCGRVGVILQGQWAAVRHRLLHHHFRPGFIAGGTVQSADGGSGRSGLSVFGKCLEPVPVHRFDPVLTSLWPGARCAQCV